MRILAILCFGLQIAFAQCGSTLYPFAGGNGTENDPYQISTVKQLLDLEKCLGSDYQNNHYILNNDIDLTEYLSGAGNDEGKGWKPIAFSGKLFDGNGHKMSGLWINRASDSVGLFKSFREIKNLGVEIDDSKGGIKGRGYAGGLAGSVGTISNSYTTGSVTGWSYAGGLAGGSVGTISNSYTTGSVTGSGHVGGLAGSANTISDSHATGDVTGGGDYIGGLAGSAATISNSYATGSVTGTGYWSGNIVGGLAVYGNNVGGLAGSAYTISNSYATGSVTGYGNVGGLVGYLKDGDIGVRNSYAEGNVTGGMDLVSENGSSGGLVGYNDSRISNSYATGNVTSGGGLVHSDGRYGSKDGGLVGFNNVRISNSYATGNVTSGGGLVHSNKGFVVDSYATGNVTNGGGLVQSNSGTITNSYAIGNVTNGGGLVQSNSGTISSSYYDMETTSMWDSGKGKGKTTAEMKTQSTYEDWDFVCIWGINEGTTYPYLKDTCSTTPILPPQIATLNSANIAKNAIALQVQNTAHLEIYNLNGRLQKTLNFKNGTYNVQISDLPKGMYIANVRFSNSDKKILRLVVK